MGTFWFNFCAFSPGKMDQTLLSILTCIIVATLTLYVVKLLNMLWFKPKRLEKYLRNQGLNGNPYRPFLGDLKDYMNVMKAEQPRSIQLSDDTIPHVFAYYHQVLSKYGQNSFIWFGPWPRLNVTDPELIKEILKGADAFEKPFRETGKTLTGGGLVLLEGEKWAKHRKIINPAFHLEKLKNMVPAIGISCSNMIQELKDMVSRTNQSPCEVDVWPYLKDLAGDIISRTAFGNNHEEGRRIFHLQSERVKLGLQLLQFSFVPGWRYVPTKANRKLKAISNEIQSILRDVIQKRQKSMETKEEEEEEYEDLLGILMESNSRFNQEEGKGMSIEDVIEECQTFYFAGSETTASLLVWTIVLLCKHPEWQTQAREEVGRVFGNSQPTFQGLNNLKTVTMILQEVLRLYPPSSLTVRAPRETTKVGNLVIPAGVQLTLLTGLPNHDSKIWGQDVKEFKPQRFNGGIQSSFLPFGTGPRICIGQNFAMIEAKMVLAMILQHFWFELSPSYVHAPFSILILEPQYGAPIILHHVESLSVY